MGEESEAIRIAVLETEVNNLKAGHGEIRADLKALAEKLNMFMVKTAVATAGLTGALNVALNHWGK